MWFIWVVTPLGQKRIRPEERKPGLWAQLELNLAGNFQGKHGLPLGIKESMARNISSSNPVPISWGFSGGGGNSLSCTFRLHICPYATGVPRSQVTASVKPWDSRQRHAVGTEGKSCKHRPNHSLWGTICYGCG